MSLPISIVAVEAGIAKEVLRKCEVQYGFPAPARDVSGNRMYSAEQLERLKLIKKLIDDGNRPGEIVSLPLSALEALLGQQAASKAVPPIQETSIIEQHPIKMRPWFSELQQRL